MRWGVVSLILGWTIGLVSIPLVLVGLYSLYVEGFEQAIRTFAFPAIISLLFGYLMISRQSIEKLTSIESGFSSDCQGSHH